MNRELIKQLYLQSTEVCRTNIAGSSTAWTWETEFARLIVLECSRVAKLEMKDNRVCDAIERHFGIES